MSRLSTQERQQAIVRSVLSDGAVSVEMLSKRFKTSEVTIRKDLRKLESAKKLVRRFGGAVKVPAQGHVVPHDEVSNRKSAIAKLAFRLIKPNARLVIDSGSTVSALLPFIQERKDLVVMTNSLRIANQLTAQENHPQLLFTGGTWDHQSDAFQGQMAEKMLRAYDFDIAFIGAAGLDPNRGTTTFNELTNLSQVMAEVSKQVVILAESDKLNKRIPNVELPWQQITTLITDDTIPSGSLQAIKQHGVTVLCASEKES